MTLTKAILLSTLILWAQTSFGDAPGAGSGEGVIEIKHQAIGYQGPNGEFQEEVIGKLIDTLLTNSDICRYLNPGDALRRKKAVLEAIDIKIKGLEAQYALGPNPCRIVRGKPVTLDDVRYACSSGFKTSGRYEAKETFIVECNQQPTCIACEPHSAGCTQHIFNTSDVLTSKALEIQDGYAALFPSHPTVADIARVRDMAHNKSQSSKNGYISLKENVEKWCTRWMSSSPEYNAGCVLHGIGFDTEAQYNVEAKAYGYVELKFSHVRWCKDSY